MAARLWEGTSSEWVFQETGGRSCWPPKAWAWQLGQCYFCQMLLRGDIEPTNDRKFEELIKSNLLSYEELRLGVATSLGSLGDLERVCGVRCLSWTWRKWHFHCSIVILSSGRGLDRYIVVYLCKIESCKSARAANRVAWATWLIWPNFQNIKLNFCKVEIGYMQYGHMMIMTEFSQSFLCAKRCSKYFACINPFNCLNSPMR